MKHFHLSVFLLPVSLLGLSQTDQLAAQSRTVTTVPAVYTDAFTNSDILTPFGRTKYFGQTWYSGKGLPSILPVTQLGFRTGPARTYAALQCKIEIVLDNSQVQFNTLSKTFTANLSSAPTTFLPMTTLNVPAANQNQDPNTPALWIPGSTVFLYTGPNLICQTDVQTAATPSSTGYNVEGYSMSTATPFKLVSRGQGCGNGSLTHAYTATSQQYSLNASGVGATMPVLMHLGVSPLRTPVDLGIMGMNGCELYQLPLVSLGLLSDGAGNAVLQGTLPATLPTSLVFAQASHPQPGANPLGYAATNGTAALLGADEISTYVYNWTTFSATAQYGPYTTNRGQVMLMR